MKTIREVFRESPACVVALLLVCAIPLFPEYVAPVLVMGSLIAAGMDARHRGEWVQIGTTGKLLLLYILYMALGILYSSHKLNSLSTVLMWAVMFCGYLSVTTVVFTRRRLQTALFFFTVAAGLVGLIAATQYLLRDIFNLDLPNQVWKPLDEIFYRYFPMDVDIHIATHRAAATFTNPNIMSEYLVMAIPFAALCGFHGARTRSKLVARFCLLLALLGVAVSFSRGAYLALLAMLLLIIVTNLRRVTPLLLSLVAAASLVPEAIIARFMAIGSVTDSSISQRFAAWDIAVQAIIESPLTGLGPGISNFAEYVQAMGVNVPHAHNVILQILLEGGFIALFLLVLVATKVLQSGIELLNHSPKTHLFGVFFLVFAISFVVYGMVDYPFLCPKLVGPFLMILGLTDATSALYLQRSTTPLNKVVTLLFRKQPA